MGEPIVRKLIDVGIEVRAFDRDPARLAAVAGHPGVVAESDLAGVAGCNLVACMLPDTATVREVIAGSGGLLGLMRSGSLIVDMGSSEPRSTEKLAAEAARRGVGLVDAPVSGGVAKAMAGELTVMFGGSVEQLARCRPLLDAVGSRVMHIGPVGSGHAVKALNNLLSAVGLAAATEVVEIGRRYGIESETLLEAINHSTGRNHATETKISQFVLSGTYASGFKLRLMLKDVRTAVELGRELGVDLALGEACLERWSEAAVRLPVDADQTQIALVPAGHLASNLEVG